MEFMVVEMCGSDEGDKNMAQILGEVVCGNFFRKK
jgi:hypothetical protein